MFAFDLAGIEPDIMCLSKGLTGGFLPLGATVCTGPVRETFRSRDRTRTFFHGHSYTANPLACAAGIASLKIFESAPVFERIARVAQVHGVDEDDRRRGLEHRQQIEAEGPSVDDPGARREGAGPAGFDRLDHPDADALVAQQDVADPQHEDRPVRMAHSATSWTSGPPSRAAWISRRVTNL